jgi:hypothetical protein
MVAFPRGLVVGEASHQSRCLSGSKPFLGVDVTLKAPTRFRNSKIDHSNRNNAIIPFLGHHNSSLDLLFFHFLITE